MAFCHISQSAQISIFLGVTFSLPIAYNVVNERQVIGLMEFILIEKTKLKVTLTAYDMQSFGVCAKELDYTTPETKKMLREILSRAETELGFEYNDHRTLVQVYTSKKGDCEIFITRLDTPETDGAVHYRSIYDMSDRTRNRGMFGFDKLEYLLSVCKRLYDIGYSGNSSAFVGDDRRFYLLLDSLHDPEYSPVDEYSFICEYGESENIIATTEYLFEHGKEICRSDAVETLSVL